MEFYNVINERHTIRDFADREVDMEVIHRIIDAGLKAPTNDHMRNWEFVVITDKEEKAKIIRKIKKTFSKEEVTGILDDWNMTDACQRDMYLDGVPKQYSMLYRGGCLILPFFRQDHPLLTPETINSLNSFASIWCCIENMLLATTAEGLGAAFRIPFPDELVYLKEYLGHPDNYYLPCYLSIGYPAENTSRPKQHHFTPQAKIHINKW